MPPFIVEFTPVSSMQPDIPRGSVNGPPQGATGRPALPDDEQCSAARRIVYAAGQTLAQAVYLSGCFAPPVLCSGLAHCGRCRMRILSAPDMPPPTGADNRCFSKQELALGWRLGCRHLPQPLLRAELPCDTRQTIFASEPVSARDGSCLRGAPRARMQAAHGVETGEVQEDALPREHKRAGLAGARPGLAATPRARDGVCPAKAYALAVDLGTTSLEWVLFPLREQDDVLPAALWRGLCVNPQMGAGSDVLSRLAFARTPEGRTSLHRLTVTALRAIMEESRRRAETASPGAAVTALCLAGNPTITALALNLDITGLAAAPYVLPERGGRWAALPGLPPAWIPPQISPFVGGDIAAGYASLTLDPATPSPDYPFLLADMGTNGEFLLALNQDTALAASVALGPALEGAGLRMGTEARPGAASGFSLRPDGLTVERIPAAPEDSLPGITGTGYLSLLHILLQGGAIDRNGHFRNAPAGPLRRLPPPERDPRGDLVLSLPYGLRLYASDIEELLKVKAAFALGVQRLLAAAGIASRDLAGVHLAGALGRHVDKTALEHLGFFPPGMVSRLRAIGNSSLAGAMLLLRRAEARDALPEWAAGKVESVDLASDPGFAEAFAAHMHFAW